ncbi:MFS transporter [Emcibacter sp. SYSU 3D8]|uniref:MFS transporter n=1 Tax=Emcibacter sp. SYSU 3D8 TaxID=3133969 RepID=UPI0031FE5E03
MPWYYGWNVVGVGMSFQAITFGLTLYVYGFWVKPLADEFGASRFDIMLGLMLLNVVMGLAAPFAGRAMDIKPIRLLIIGGALAMAAGFVIAGLAPALWVFVGAYALLVSMGVLLAGPLASSTLSAKWFRARRGLAIGWSSVGTSIGGLAMPAVVTWLILNEGWRNAHFAMALIVLVGIVPVVWLIVANTPEDKGIEPEPESTKPHLIAQAAKARPWTTGQILSERSFWAAAIAFGFLTMVFGGVQAHLVPYVQDRGLAGENPAILMSVMAFAGIIGKILFGAATDRLSHRLLFYSASVVLAAALILLRLLPSFDVLIVASALLGLATGGFLPLIGAVVAGQFGPIAFGRVMGLLGPFTMPVAVLGPPLAGYIFDLTGSYVQAFELFLGMIVIAGVAVIFLRDTDMNEKPLVTPAE